MNRSEISSELQSLQKQRAWYIKSINMVSNRLQATIAGAIGYHSGLTEKMRTNIFTEAGKLIKRVQSGKEKSEHEPLILTTSQAIDGFEEMKKSIEKEMIALARELPVIEWVRDSQQRGFGELFLGIVIGETGDLANYSNPGKVWRRMGCAPWTKNDETLMGSTWRKRSKSKTETKLHKADWEEYGYSPRRRAISFLVGDGLIKQNKSIYRERYMEAKVKKFHEHPEWNWSACDKCKNDGTDCSRCGGVGHKCLRAHLHANLMAAKLLYKNLWIEWNPDLYRSEYAVETEMPSVAVEVLN